jgi:rod shape-determining protein MreD
MSVPRSYSIGAAWIVGIIVDVTQGTLLGQYALALSAITYITVKSHLLMRVFPLLQLTATIFALLALYQFLLFWINGVAGVSAPAVTYWGPVLTGSLIWPLLYTFMSGVRYRVQLGH